MTDHKHDIAIVGAGPGGSAAAYFLARAGFDVALIDKATFPRDKTCGDGVSPRALHVLEQMGLLQSLTAQSFRINYLDLYAPNSTRCVATVPRMAGLPDYTLVVPRYVLDDAVRNRALEAGATPYQMEVTDAIRDNNGRISGVRSLGSTVSARLTIFATGATTRLLQQVGLLKHKPTLMVAARQYFENLPPFDDHLEFYFDHVALPGYAWLFPTSTTTANIGAGYLGDRNTSPRTMLETCYQTHPRLRELLREAKPVGPIKGYPLRIDFPDSNHMVNGALALGEAIGLVNPFTGEGIDYALESGQIAAETIIAAKDFSEAGLSDYSRQLNARFRHMFVFLAHMRNLFYNTFMLNRLFGRGASVPYIRNTVMDVCFGDTDPWAVFSPKMFWELFKP
jgi:geranylgeranyl reductase family protein